MVATLKYCMMSGADGDWVNVRPVVMDNGHEGGRRWRYQYQQWVAELVGEVDTGDAAGAITCPCMCQSRFRHTSISVGKKSMISS